MASNKSKTPGPIQVVVVLMLTVLAFYFGNRFGQVFDFNTMEITDGALATVNSIVAAPAAISMASVPMLYAIGLAITVLIVWLYTFMYAGNYRYGEEAGSAKWGTLKEGVAFKEVGGSLADSLERIGDTIDARLSLRRHIESETSSVIASMKALIVMLLILFAIIMVGIPQAYDFYTQDPLGIPVLIVVVLFAATGSVIIYKMADIDVE